MYFLFLVGMKSFVTDEKELIMEPCLKFAGNPNIIVAVKACGLKATVQVTLIFFCVYEREGTEVDAKHFITFQVVDLQVFLMPRVTLKPLVPAFPCFCNIFVSLMEKVCDSWVNYFLHLLYLTT